MASVYFSGEATFGDSVIQSYGSRDILITRLSKELTGIGSDPDIAMQAIDIYPNPANDKVLVEMNRMLTNVSLEILDINGRRIKSLTLLNGQSSVDFSEYPAGIYIFKILNMNGTIVESRKVIKE